ncbi:MAG: trigger factor [Alphaproteobacteria bacterium]|nr:MAG: trigger factor [Alphaproteobacteria bacterium]
MQVTETVSNGLSREFKIVIGADELDQRLMQRLNEVQAQVQMKGFRPGKVPVAHLKKTHGKGVMSEIIQEAISGGMQEALQERDMRPAMQPNVDLPENIEPILEGKSDLEFTMAVELMPDFEPMDLSALDLEREIAGVTDAEADKALEEIAKQQRVYKDRDDSAKSQMDDQVVIDFVGSIDGEEFEGGSGKGVPLVLGSNQFIPGFEEQLVGAKVGDEIDVKVSFPETYQVEELAGKPALFKTTVRKVSEPSTPEVNEDLAKQLGMESLEDLRTAVKARLLHDLADVSRAKLKRQLLDKLDEAHDFDLPPGMVEAEFDQIWQQVTSGNFADEEPVEDTEEERAEYRTIAERRVRLGLLLAEIGTRNNIVVSQDELGRALQEQARQYPGQERQIYEFYQKNPGALEQIRAPIFEDKVVDYIFEMATVTDRKVTREELERDPDDETPAKEAAPKKKAAAKKKPAEKKAAPKKKAEPKKKAAEKKTTAKKKTAAKKKTTAKKAAK